MRIAVDDLSVSFDGAQVFERVNLEIPERGILRIDGPSGCGKTTLLRTIAGLTEPDSGTVNGIAELRLSYVFQEDRLLPWRSALYNVAVVSDRTQAVRWLTAVGLADALDKLPAELSGGMRRRVAIARALAYDGDMLILDEPFSGIDARIKAELIVPLILAFAAERPVLLVTHDALDAQLIGPHITHNM